MESQGACAIKGINQLGRASKVALISMNVLGSLVAKAHFVRILQRAIDASAPRDFPEIQTSHAKVKLMLFSALCPSLVQVANFALRANVFVKEVFSGNHLGCVET